MARIRRVAAAVGARAPTPGEVDSRADESGVRLAGEGPPPDASAALSAVADVARVFAGAPRVVAGTVFRGREVLARSDGSVRVEPERRPAVDAGFTIHLRTRALRMDEKAGVMVDEVRFVCTAKVQAGEEATPILAPLDHPSFCPYCREGRAAMKSGARVEPVMVRARKVHAS